MTLETFFEKFDLFADAPDAVAQMRELVLRMAVQGRLVEQSQEDGSAVVLLEKLGSNALLAFDIMAYMPVDPPLPSLPGNWRWAPTSMLCDLQTGKRMKGGAQDSGVVSLGGEHLQPDGTVDYTVPRYVSREFYDQMPKGKVEIHDTLMVKDGATTGKTAFVSHLPSEGLAAVNEHVFILRWHAPIAKKFAYYFIRAFALRHIATKSAGLIGGIRREAVLDFPFPLPPLAEQKRIVAKVDELMALCDRLEAQQQERETRHAALVSASLARFADAPTPSSLDFLFNRSYDIAPADLRSSILTLAVQGKLVSQNPEDGVARELIDRAMKKRKETIESRNLRRKRLDESAELFSRDDLPESWCVERLANLVDPENTISYGVLVPGSDVSDGIPFVRVLRYRQGVFRRAATFAHL